MIELIAWVENFGAKLLCKMLKFGAKLLFIQNYQFLDLAFFSVVYWLIVISFNMTRRWMFLAHNAKPVLKYCF